MNKEKILNQSLEEWVIKTREALKIEQNQDREIEGNIFGKDFIIENVSTGFLGRQHVEFKVRKNFFLTGYFTTGDRVIVKQRNNSRSMYGAVINVRSRLMCIDLGKGFDMFTDTAIDFSELKFSIELTPDNKTHSLYLRTLDKFKTNSNISLISGFFEAKSPGTENLSEENKVENLNLFNSELNQVQKEAVEKSVSTKDFFLIIGPPGTGKTTCIAEVLLQSLLKNSKMLICAPSNIAVDNILIKFIKEYKKLPKKYRKKISLHKIVRIGHPAKSSEEIHPFLLESRVNVSDENQIVSDIKKELKETVDSLYGNKKVRNQVPFKERKSRLNDLRRDLRVFEKKSVANIFSTAQVIFSTNASTYKIEKYLSQDSQQLEPLFDLCIIDEAAQSLEVNTFAPLLLSKRFILVGDNKQLGPTIKSTNTEVQSQLNSTLFDRLLFKMRATRSIMLETQYRMNEKICEWPSETFYEGILRPDISITTRELEINSDEPKFGPLVLVDTSGQGYEESEDAAGSKFNEYEANLVLQHINDLLKAGVTADEIGVITPYKAQVNAVKSILSNSENARVEVNTVDGFQGREKECIIFSFVRSNTRGDLGFLVEARRLNVALTRAKSHLYLVGDISTIHNGAKNKLAWLTSLLSHLEIKALSVSLSAEVADFLISDQAPSNHSKSKKSTAIRTVQKAVAKAQEKTPTVRHEKTHRFSSVNEPEVGTFDYQSAVDKFLSSPTLEFQFDPNLTSAERRLIHLYCESLSCSANIEHLTVDNVLCLRKVDQVKAGEVKAVEPSITIANKFDGLRPGPEADATQQSSKQEPFTVNPSLKVSNRSVEGSKKAKKKVKKKNRKQQVSDMDLLDSIIAGNKVCNASECTREIEGMKGYLCVGCNRKHCVYHRHGFKHGCSDEKVESAKNALHSSRPSINPSRRMAQRQVITKKISEMKKNRGKQRKKK
eukprot:maker-scaffold_121-snap-gene-0.8-mRNA-1 protein AED:0.16 eAED:0.16 QI:0/0/0/1/1/1/2/0/946